MYTIKPQSEHRGSLCLCQNYRSRSPAFARAQWDFWTHPPTRWTQQMRGQCSRFPVSSRRDQMTKQKHQEVKDHECGTVSTGYYTIIHPWVKTYEKLSSLNRGVFFLFVCLFVFSSFNRQGLGTGQVSLLFRFSQVAIKSMCHLVGFVIWRFGWSSMCFQTHSRGWQNSLPCSWMA